MQNFDFYVDYPVTGSNWTLIPQPDNWQAMEIELSFEDLSPDAVFNATKLIWKGSNAGIMNTWLTAGLTGGVGIFEGIGLQIRVCDSQEVVFNGIIDLTDPETKFACDIVQVSIRDTNIDMFQQLVDSISFAYLTTIPGKPGYIQPGNIINGTGDFVPIAYQRNDIPSLESVMTLILLLWDIYQIIEEIVDAVENAVDEFAAALAALFTFPPDVALSAAHILLFLLWTAYATLLIVVLIKLLESAVSCLVSPVLQKYGMFARTLLQKGCDYFGLQFQSTILNDPNSQYYNAVIMPTKNAWIDNETQNIAVSLFSSNIHLKEYDDVYNLSHGGSAYGYYDGSMGDLIRSLEDVFNAKAKIILNSNGQPVLHFERWDYQYVYSQYTLPPISDQTPFNSHGAFNNTGQSQSSFYTNANDIIANYSIKWAIDSNDVNTLDEYDGTSCFATTQPINITGGQGGSYQNRVLLKNLKEINFEFAQATRKEHVTAMENFFEDAYAFLYYVIYIPSIVLTLGALAGAGLPAPPLGMTKTGHLLLSEDTTGAPKMFIAGGIQSYNTLALDTSNHSAARNFSAYTINPNNKGNYNPALASFTARSLMKNFHYSTLAESIAPNDIRFSTPYPPGQTHYNQWFLYKDQQIPLCCADYQLVKQNNYITLSPGTVINGATQAKVDSLRWNPFKGIATIDYRVNSAYTNNLNVTFVVDGVDTFNINTI